MSTFTTLDHLHMAHALRLAERGATVESQGDNVLDPRAAGKDA